MREKLPIVYGLGEKAVLKDLCQVPSYRPM